MPFGEEISTSQRTSVVGYSGDSVRKQFTGYERDGETSLDFAQNRQYNAEHGRFTSTDPLLASPILEDPRSWNRYLYVLDSPLQYVDPAGLYACGSSLSEKQCTQFEQARIDLEKARDYYQKKGDTTKADSLTSALKGIGTLNDKNGLTIEIGKVKDGAAAETSFGKGPDGKPLLANEVDGKYVANVTMTFKDGGAINVENLAHEGNHADDHQSFIRAMFLAADKNPLITDDEVKSLPENLTRYTTESKAYHASSYIEEYNNAPGEFWNHGWKEVDRQKAIDHTLKTNDLYKVTPAPGQQGPRLYETTPKK